MTTFFQSLRSRRTNLAQLHAEELTLLHDRHLAEAARVQNELAERNSPLFRPGSAAFLDKCSLEPETYHLRVETNIPCVHDWHRTEQPQPDGIVHVYCRCTRCHTEGACCIAVDT